jgi:hypothetical protein
MARPPEQPRFALVRWPNGQIGCIPVANLMVATIRHAVFIADERDLLPWPVSIEPAQSNPIRTDADDGA